MWNASVNAICARAQGTGSTPSNGGKSSTLIIQLDVVRDVLVVPPTTSLHHTDAVALRAATLPPSPEPTTITSKSKLAMIPPEMRFGCP